MLNLDMLKAVESRVGAGNVTSLCAADGGNGTCYLYGVAAMPDGYLAPFYGEMTGAQTEIHMKPERFDDPGLATLAAVNAASIQIIGLAGAAIGLADAALTPEERAVCYMLVNEARATALADDEHIELLSILEPLQISELDDAVDGTQWGGAECWQPYASIAEGVVDRFKNARVTSIQPISD